MLCAVGHWPQGREILDEHEGRQASPLLDGVVEVMPLPAAAVFEVPDRVEPAVCLAELSVGSDSASQPPARPRAHPRARTRPRTRPRTHPPTHACTHARRTRARHVQTATDEWERGCASKSSGVEWGYTAYPTIRSATAQNAGAAICTSGDSPAATPANMFTAGRCVVMLDTCFIDVRPLSLRRARALHLFLLRSPEQPV